MQIELFKAGVITLSDVLEAQIVRVAAALSKTLPQNYRDGRFPDFRNKK